MHHQMVRFPIWVSDLDKQLGLFRQPYHSIIWMIGLPKHQGFANMSQVQDLRRAIIFAVPIGNKGKL